MAARFSYWLRLMTLMSMCVSNVAYVFPDSIRTISDSINSAAKWKRYVIHSVSDNEYSLTEKFSAYKQVDFSLSGVHLIADSNSLVHDIEIQCITLSESQAQPLTSPLICVTGGHHAYRLLPNGEHFSSGHPARLEIAYEPLSLPPGFSHEDVYTYYYDERKQSWQQLRRVAVDTIHHIVISETTHFTDFINAVIRKPEMPEVNAFVPTQLSDIEEPDPLSGVPIITEPEANMHGTAELTYPIEIPAGRNGMQPDISLRYSSGSGNGVLGYGWSISQPAITIDTRWGVPRYDSRFESEIYMLENMQIVQKDSNPELELSYQSHNLLNRSSGNVTFIARDTKNCDLIVRHGDSPRKYWWSVTGRDGTTRYYGKYSTDTDVNNNCVLKDASGNIGYWALSEMTDLYGNYVRYEYNVSGSNEIYLKNIFYTGHRSSNGNIDTEPSYRVFFHYFKREDKIQDGRLGFIRQTDSLMCYIDIANINYGNNDAAVNHRFIIHYGEESEALITKINDFPYQSVIPWSTEGDCYSDINWLMGGLVSSCVDFKYNLLPQDSIFGATRKIRDNREEFIPVSKSSSKGWNVGGAVTVGIGFNYMSSNFGAGGNYNYSQSSGKTEQMLLDINGDGLTDIVYIKDNSIYFRPQKETGDSIWFDDEVDTGIPAKGLSAELSKTHTWGLQAGAEIAGANANISGGMSYTDSYVSCYFADINGDGLPDYIDDGKVYFNRLNSHGGFSAYNGNPEVIIDSTQCGSNFYYDGEAEVVPDCFTRDSIVSQYTYSFTPSDCEFGYQGTESGNTEPDVPSYYWDGCDDCITAISEYIQNGHVAIDLYTGFVPQLRMLRNSDEARADNPEPEELDSVVLNCLRYCNYELVCEECLDSYFMYLSNPYEPVLAEQYRQCKLANGCRTICWECYDYYRDGDYTTYLECADQHCLNGMLGALETQEECLEACLEDIDSCKNCLNIQPPYPVCLECTDACADDPIACNECKLEYNCIGGIHSDCADVCLSDVNEGEEEYWNMLCGDCLVQSGLYCAECEEVCQNNPDSCKECVLRHCRYGDTYAYQNECYSSALQAANAGLNNWKTQVRQQYDNVWFSQEGNTYYAHVTDTICKRIYDPNIEAVRVWVAPQDGVVSLSNSIRLIEDSSQTRQQSRNADGVRCIIQHNKNVSVNEEDTTRLHAQAAVIIGSVEIDADDYSLKSMNYDNINVSEGDIFFFRLMSVRTHSFDNVEWQQSFTYTDGRHYSSVNDYVCSGKEIFQAQSNGVININADVTCTGGSSAELKLINGLQQQQIPVNSSTGNVSCTLTYQAGDNVSFLITPVNGNLGNIEVRPHLHFAPSVIDSLHQEYDMWIAPQISDTSQNSFSTLYNDLFGVLYRGWGQFAYNDSVVAEIIVLDSLYNPARQCATNTPTDSIAFVNSISAIRNDSSQWMTPNGLSEQFSGLNMYDPLSYRWVPMSADIRNYNMEAYGQVARNGRHLLSNAREKKRMVSLINDTIGNNFQSIDIYELDYDSDVPILSSSQPATAVRKTSRTTQWNINAGAGYSPGGVGLGVAYSESDYMITTDFMDMNGDCFPDIVRPASIQYTQPWGGLGANKATNNTIYSNHSVSRGNSFSGNYPINQKAIGNKLNDGKFEMHMPGSTGGQTSRSNSVTSLTYMDINGDGLPDKIERTDDGVYVSLNIGYGFDTPHLIPAISQINNNTSSCVGANAGLSLASTWAIALQEIENYSGPLSSTYASMFQLSIVLGVDFSTSISSTDYRLIDMDADGMLDIVKQNGNNLDIIFVKPYGANGSTRVNNHRIQSSESLNWSLNTGLTVGFPVWMFIKMTIGVNGSPIGGTESQSMCDIIDMNGDGLPDLVWSTESGIYVRYNNMGRNRLLNKVYNSTGQIYQLDYELSAPSTEQRGRRYQLSQVKNIIAQHGITGCDTIAKRIVYSDPHYNAAERTPMGYGSVETLELQTNTHPYSIYRKTKRHYNNTDFSEHGKLIYEAVTDSSDNRYSEYRLDSLIYVDHYGEVTDNICKDATIKIKKEAHITTYFSQNETDSIVTAKRYDYDKYHNVVSYSNLGDMSTDDDNLSAEISYRDASSGSNQERNLISLPTRVIVNAGTSTLRHTEAVYNDKGRLTAHKQIDPASQDSSVTNYEYDSFGMPSRFIMPENHSGQRATVEVEYDSYSHTLPVSVTDQWGRSVRTLYHKFWQKPTQITDPSGSTIRYTYDKIGRPLMIQTYLDTIDMPQWLLYMLPYDYAFDFNSLKPYSTVSYKYIPCMQLRRENPYVYTNIRTRWEGASTDTITIKTEYDRRGRLLQRKHKRDDGWIVRDITATDCFSRTVATYKPFYTQRDTTGLYAGNLQLLSTHDYDILDRQTGTHWQDNASSFVIYDIAEDAYGVKRLAQFTTDENGNQWKTFTSPQGWTTTMITPDRAVTRFTYDALGQLLSSTDPDGLMTTHAYDGFGRRTQRSHPDAGITRWQYDHAGNMTASQTQRQINSGQQTTYHYSYNRLDSVCYSEYPETNVYYEYDSVSGRLLLRTDLAGYERFKYDPLGNVCESKRVMMMSAEEHAYQFTTKYRYDALGKMREITYPDNERVEYKYKDGLLTSIKGIENNNSSVYIDTIVYDKYDRQEELYYGNGVTSYYAYDTNRNWLTSKETVLQGGTTLEEKYYTYDSVGNITNINQTAANISLLGGEYTINYTYDKQNRLRMAVQESSELGNYSYELRYSPSGCLGQKQCPAANTNLAYGYANDGSQQLMNHCVSSIYDSYSETLSRLKWDADGNLTTIYKPCYNQVREHVWNEAGQMAGYIDNSHCGYYVYDGDGNRVYKLTGTTTIDQYNAGNLHANLHFDDAVLYVNPYMVVTPQGITKHYYNGSQRIAAKMAYANMINDSIVNDGWSGHANHSWEFIRTLLQNTDCNVSPQIYQPGGVIDIDISGWEHTYFMPECEDIPQIACTSVSYDRNMIYQVFDVTPDPTYGDNIFYYHGDHLGSATWITDTTGNSVQFLMYLPYGELWRNQQRMGYDERFKFTGKERDAETGYDYFGARYYDSRALTGWISPDPLMDKYPNISPYAYCGWNPINAIDPDGRDSIYINDQSERPLDRGVAGETYTATIVVVQNGESVGVYRGSSYPNSTSNSDNSTPFNTINEGDYPFNNKYGHKGGTEKGLNIVDTKGNRFVPGKKPNGEDVTIKYGNIHSGKSDNGNYNSRGSQACITIHPDDAEAFFSHFSWTNDMKTKGNSTGRIFIKRNKNTKEDKK
ncbi:MAG: hypothetical protein IJ650_01895 [Paludibacteraceae bacterium]|nr:hypothetical protein [Paludibacteraceae bacterium]